MFRQNKLSMAVKMAAGLAVASVPVQAVLAADDAVLEEIVVTGSRIARTNFDTSAQLVSMDRVHIDAQGSLAIADVLRDSPVNTFGSFSERSGSSWQSNATIDLRGMGPSRTLTMINGRRMVGSPNMGAAQVNLNMIPMTAVERVDILADGGSAVYGSDAVAGVVNMVMRKNFEGLEFTVRRGDRSEDDGKEEAVGMLMGLTSDRGSITVSAEWNHRDPIFDADRDYTSAWIRDTDGDGVIATYIDTDGISFYGKSVELYDPNTGYDIMKAAVGCPETNGFVGVQDAGPAVMGGPTGVHTLCGYAYANVSANKAELDRHNMYVSATYEINSKVEFFSDLLFSRVESFGRYAPPAAAWPNMPSDYKDVPFDIPALLASGAITEDYSLTGYYRWTNIGPRDNNVQDTQFDMIFGLKGDITDDVSYEVYVQNSRYDSKENSYYYLSYTGLDYVLNQGIDPFSPEGAAAMRANPIQDNFSTLRKIYGQVQFGAGDFTGGGETIVLLGGEYFESNYNNQYDSQSEAGLIGGSAGNSSGGDRDVTALFAEAVIPVTADIEVNAAVRYDDYSDFGDNISPSISGSWHIMDDLRVRGRWSQGFRAPSLSVLYGPSSFSAETAKDYLKCEQTGTPVSSCPNRQIDTWYITNPDVDAETSDSFSLGVNWEFVSGWTVDVGYYNIQLSDVIGQSTTQSVLNAEFAGVNMPQGSDTYVDRSKGQPVVYSSGTNAGELNTDGVDIQLRGLVDTDFGSFNLGVLIVNTLSYESAAYHSGPAQDQAGFNLAPDLKMQGTLSWYMGNHSVDFVVDYVGPSGETDTLNISDDGSIKLVTSSAELDSWTTMNLAYSYDFESYGKIKIGARNITNEEPVFDSEGKFGDGHANLYDQTGRVVYGEYKISF